MWVCIHVLGTGMETASFMHLILLYPLTVSDISMFCHIISQTAPVSKTLLSTKYVLIFSNNCSLKISNPKKNLLRYYHKFT
jgi:hypothetical protein